MDLDNLDEMIDFLKQHNDQLKRQNKLLHGLLDLIHEKYDVLKPELLDLKAKLETDEKIENLNEIIQEEHTKDSRITSEYINDLKKNLDKYDNLDDLLKLM